MNLIINQITNTKGTSVISSGIQASTLNPVSIAITESFIKVKTSFRILGLLYHNSK